MTIKINEEHLGDIANERDAKNMVSILSAMGYDVGYGQPTREDEKASNIPDKDWDRALDITNQATMARKSIEG